MGKADCQASVNGELGRRGGKEREEWYSVTHPERTANTCPLTKENQNGSTDAQTREGMLHFELAQG